MSKSRIKITKKDITKTEAAKKDNTRSKAEKSKRRIDKKEISEMIKNTLIMLAITLVAGGILGAVYDITKEPIARMEEKAKTEANAKVFENASSFSDDILDVEAMKKAFEGTITGVDITEVLEAKDAAGERLGYVMEVTSHEGYGGDIVFRVGIQNDGTTNGISITSISETAGLGMKAPVELVPQFKDKKVDSFEVTKTGATNDSQIDAISSATITSKAVVKGVNGALCYFKEVLGGGSINE